MRPITSVAALVLTLTLTACGGGGSDPANSYVPNGGGDPHARGGGGGGTGDDASFCLRLTHKLQDCGFMSQGEINCDPDDAGEGPYLSCLADCIDAATCSDLESYYCEDVGTLAMYTCYSGCDEDQPQFTCADGETIPLDWRCDLEEDCDDGSDEVDCSAAEVFQCQDSEDAYVPTDYRCDGYEDCDDGSDEDGCPPGTGFSCADGGVVPHDWACDGYDDCGDGSDEVGCPVFDCGDGTVVSAAFRCDEEADCADGADEAGCAVWLLPCMQDGGGGGSIDDVYVADE